MIMAIDDDDDDDGDEDDGGDDGDDGGDDDDEGKMMMLMLGRRKMMMLRRKTNPKTGKHTACLHMDASQKPFLVRIFTGKNDRGHLRGHRLCEPVQSKCRRTLHNRHFLRKFTGKCRTLLTHRATVFGKLKFKTRVRFQFWNFEVCQFDF